VLLVIEALACVCHRRMGFAATGVSPGLRAVLVQVGLLYICCPWATLRSVSPTRRYYMIPAFHRHGLSGMSQPHVMSDGLRLRVRSVGLGLALRTSSTQRTRACLQNYAGDAKPPRYYHHSHLRPREPYYAPSVVGDSRMRKEVRRIPRLGRACYVLASL
jgi:hypothetical protein